MPGGLGWGPMKLISTGFDSINNTVGVVRPWPAPAAEVPWIKQTLRTCVAVVIEGYPCACIIHREDPC